MYILGVVVAGLIFAVFIFALWHIYTSGSDDQSDFLYPDCIAKLRLPQNKTKNNSIPANVQIPGFGLHAPDKTGGGMFSMVVSAMYIPTGTFVRLQSDPQISGALVRNCTVGGIYTWDKGPLTERPAGIEGQQWFCTTDNTPYTFVNGKWVETSGVKIVYSISQGNQPEIPINCDSQVEITMARESLGAFILSLLHKMTAMRSPVNNQ